MSASLSTGPSTSSHRPRLNENRAEISRWIQREFQLDAERCLSETAPRLELMINNNPITGRTMFIQTETTPNADSLKFIPGSPVSTSGTHEFLTAAAASVSPLADSLFNLPGVSTVFFGPDFISVNKEDGVEWSDLKPEIYSLIMENFSAGTPLFREGSEGDGEGPEDTRILDTDSEVVAMLKELLDTRVRPTIQQDGGDIEYKGFEEDTGKVFLMLKGSCRGCSSSAGTLKLGIERMLMHYIPGKFKSAHGPLA